MASEAGRLFARLQRTREETTYRWLEVSQKEAEDAITKAEQVIEAARQLISGMRGK